MNSIVFICIITCDSCLPCLRASGPDLGWALGFKSAFQLVWLLDHLLDLHLKIQFSCFLAWHLTITLSHENDICLEFHLEHWVAWWFALMKDIWLGYHWDYNLDIHLNIDILEIYLVLCLDIWLRQYLACLFKILLDPCLTIVGTSIGVALVLVLGNSFDI